MEHVYAFGIEIIQLTQRLFIDYEGYFTFVNDAFSPPKSLELFFPLVSILDSVFAAQLVLCISFGSWLNAILKWWLLEDRPYWWLRETDYYTQTNRPVISQFRQTCEVGPGCPSGHSETAAMILMLTLFWIAHIMNDRQLNVWYWKCLAYPLCIVCLLSVMIARMFVGTHFPHQVVAGALLGAFLAPALCIYVIDPYIWQYGYHAKASVANTMVWNALSVGMTVIISLVTYYSLKLCGFDPMWTIRMAFRWCENPENIHWSTTPMSALASSTGHLLGWALCVTPTVAKYRHYTTDRSLLIAAFATYLGVQGYNHLKDSICKEHAVQYYLKNFLLCTLKVPLFLRVIPYLAMWPYAKVKTD